MTLSSSSLDHFKRNNPHTIILADPSREGLVKMKEVLHPEELHCFFNFLTMIRGNTIHHIRQITSIPEELLISNELYHSNGNRASLLFQEHGSSFSTDLYTSKEQEKEATDIFLKLAQQSNQHDRLILAVNHIPK